MDKKQQTTQKQKTINFIEGFVEEPEVTDDGIEVPDFVQKVKKSETSKDDEEIINDLVEMIKYIRQFGKPTKAKVDISLVYSDGKTFKSKRKKIFRLKRKYK